MWVTDRNTDRIMNNIDNKKNNKLTKRTWITLAIMAVVIPATLIVSWHFGNRKFYLVSVLIIIYSMIPFLFAFEKRRPGARELTCIAVLTAIAVVSRIAFIMIPNFSPILGFVMIAAFVFGPSAGFLTGSMSAFVSNFIFGQGAWTPWQMFAYGLAGFLAGILCQKGIMNPDKRLRTSIIGGVMIVVLIGPLLDTCSVFLMSSIMSKAAVISIYGAGVPVNLIHASGVFLTLLLLGKPMMEKLDRIIIKYGLDRSM